MRRRIRKIVILGCGPAGIFAAHAAMRSGLEVEILSAKRRSDMYGAQYLHSPIPGLSVGPSGEISYRLIGTAENYAQKVYGDDRPDFVSPQKFKGEYPAWDIREAYTLGYEKYEDLIINTPDIGPDSFVDGGNLATARVWNAYVDPRVQIISTIPLHKICGNRLRHTFSARKIWACGSAPELGKQLDWVTVPRDTVVCNGDRSPSWYRAAHVFGRKTVEWAYDANGPKPPYEGVVQASKVIGTDCDCWRGKMWFAGRQGTWNKSVLADSAYTFTLSALGLRAS